MGTAMRNFLQKKTYEQKNSEVLTERDWRHCREDNRIYVKGGLCPPPIRNWKDIKELPEDLK